jgi:microcystin synthetase protein McyA
MYPLYLKLPTRTGSDGRRRRSPGLGLAAGLTRPASLKRGGDGDRPDSKESPADVLKAVREQVQALPQHGIGYGLLRYLHPDPEVRAQLASLPAAQVSFNYLGQFDAGAQQSDATFRVAAEGRGPERDPNGRRQHLLEISASIVAGSLRINWRYSRNLHRQETIQRLANDFLDALQKLIEQCRQDAASGKVAVDVSQVDLTDDDLDALLEELDLDE